MATNYIQQGNSLKFTAPVALKSGEPVLVGSMFLISCNDYEVDDTDAQGFAVGCYTLPKTSADVVTQFQKAYWDSGAEEITVSASGNYKIGVFMKDYATGTIEAAVRLDGVSTAQEA